MTGECCDKCRYCHTIKSHYDGGWLVAKCCTVFIEQGEKDAFALMVQGNDMCEMYSKRDS